MINKTEPIPTNKDFETLPSPTLANIVTTIVMPETDVSERTHRSYTTGAYLMLKHLAEDNLTKFDMLDTEKALIGECLGRIVANAEAQGIFLTIPTESQP